MSYDYTELAAEARRLAGVGVPPPGRAGSPSVSSEVEGEQPVLVRDLARVVLQLLGEREALSRERDEARAEVGRLKHKLQDARDRLVDAWHDGDSQQPLHEFLGMGYDEYKRWVEGER